MFNFVGNNGDLWLENFRKGILYNLGQSFSTSLLPTFGARWFSIAGSCSVYYRMFRGIPGLYPLQEHSLCDNQKHLQTLSNITWAGQNHPRLSTCVLGLNIMMCVIYFKTLHWGKTKKPHTQDKRNKTNISVNSKPSNYGCLLYILPLFLYA